MTENTFYKIYENRIDENCRRLKEAYKGLPFIPAYSVKTNYTPAIINRFHENGFFIEVVSDMEYEIATWLGIPGNDIIYNGPMKGSLAGVAALKGAVIGFDSRADFEQRIYPKGTRCMFRVAANIDNGIDTRFGSRPDEVYGLIKDAVRAGYIPIGIHCHVTKGRDLRSWQQKIDCMAAVYTDVRHMLSEKLVDFGGNMYSPMTEEESARYDDYAGYDDYAALFAKNAERFPGAKLALESGTSVVANCMDFSTTVLAIKHTAKSTYVLLDCSKYHLGWATERYNFPMEIVNMNQSEAVENAYFVGLLCTEGDVIYTGYTGNIGVGDIVTFKNVGAYTIGVKPPFIVPHAPAYYVERDGKERYAKVDEECKDVMKTYVWR